ncbi:MAG: hypothetical protein WCK89_22870 [bacterium]
MKTIVLVVAVSLLLCALPCVADWGQAVSADFTLDTTVPEPGLIAAVILPLWLLWRRK